PACQLGPGQHRHPVDSSPNGLDPFEVQVCGMSLCGSLPWGHLGGQLRANVERQGAERCLVDKTFGPQTAQSCGDAFGRIKATSNSWDRKPGRGLRVPLPALLLAKSPSPRSWLAQGPAFCCRAPQSEEGNKATLLDNLATRNRCRGTAGRSFSEAESFPGIAPSATVSAWVGQSHGVGPEEVTGRAQATPARFAPTWGLCPRHLDCTLQRRQECPPGSHACGRCLPQFVEDGEGRCVAGAAAPKGQSSLVPSLEEEIDLLSDVLSKQGRGPLPLGQEGSPLHPGPHSRNGASKAESSQSGRRGWPDASHPITKPVHRPPVESTRISSNDALVLGLIVVCTAAGVAALVVAMVCWCRLQKEIQLAQKVDYPANKLPQLPSYDKLSPGDQKLAQSAQMYHYQHQKQQMLSMEKCVLPCGDGGWDPLPSPWFLLGPSCELGSEAGWHKEEAKAPESFSSDEENEDGDFTVYECPGLAPTGEMEVKNPLFDDSTLPPKPHP
ncbi:neural proliferation differentiation and control protein 1-like, partial [Erythrolamprus reginae]|uniref:neural proliferation differentiation and control protein 1-like n=1 Tax=Erythrolamprus reginae TaxID=121349 RepID=UPI00396C709D